MTKDKETIIKLRAKVSKLEDKITSLDKYAERGWKLYHKEHTNFIYALQGKTEAYYKVKYSGFIQDGKTRAPHEFLLKAFSKTQAIDSLKDTMFHPQSIIVDSIERLD